MGFLTIELPICVIAIPEPLAVWIWSPQDMFLDYGGDKEFGVKGYVGASFNTYPSDSE